MRRRNDPPRPPLPADPGDLSWTPYVMQGRPQTTHWIRTDDLQLFLRPSSFTIAHDGRAVTEGDVADVLALLGLSGPEVRCTFARVASQREYRVETDKLKPLIDEVAKGMSP